MQLKEQFKHYSLQTLYIKWNKDITLKKPTLNGANAYISPTALPQMKKSTVNTIQTDDNKLTLEIKCISFIQIPLMYEVTPSCFPSGFVQKSTKCRYLLLVKQKFNYHLSCVVFLE